jgi:hypothetical protein
MEMNVAIKLNGKKNWTALVMKMNLNLQSWLKAHSNYTTRNQSDRISLARNRLNCSPTPGWPDWANFRLSGD